MIKKTNGLIYRRIYDVDVFVRDYHPKKTTPRRFEFSSKGVYIGMRHPFKTKDYLEHVCLVNKNGEFCLIYFDSYTLGETKLIIEPTSGICGVYGELREYFESTGLFGLLEINSPTRIRTGVTASKGPHS